MRDLGFYNEGEWFLLTCGALWEKHSVLSNTENYEPSLLVGRNRIKIEPDEVNDGDSCHRNSESINHHGDVLETKTELKIEQHDIENEIKMEFDVNAKCLAGKMPQISSLRANRSDRADYHTENQNQITSTNSTNNIKEKFSCNYCNSTFELRKDYKRHIKRQVCKPKKKYKCPICQKYLISHQQYLKRHIDMHNGVNFFKCKVCGEEFRTYYKLTIHKKTMHNATKINFKCQQCDKEFLLKCELTRHGKIHSGIKPHKCEHCEKSFMKRSDLVRHLMTHGSEKPFKCTQCEKSCRDRWSLEQHVRYHHSDETPYPCDVCKRSFKTSSGIKQHKQSNQHKVAQNAYEKAQNGQLKFS